jgi:hypothetical protein
VENRRIKLIRVTDGLYRSADTSVNLHLAHRTWESPERRWYAAYNTLMHGRVTLYGATKAEALRDFGATTYIERRKDVAR